jgi:parallel beta-helix repeat protein
MQLSVLKVQPARAWTGTVYIRADGSIDPSDAPISRVEDAYVLTGNISSSADGIVIERSNMTLDGASYAIQGSGGGDYRGIDLSGRRNVTIMNVYIRSFDSGIYLDGSLENKIDKNNITENECGIFFWNSIASCDYNNISRNRIVRNSGYGIYGYTFSYNTYISNEITENWAGIMLDNSSNNTISGNTLFNNTLYGGWFYGCSGSNITRNEIALNGDCGIRIHGGSAYNIISENTIVQNQQYGLWSSITINRIFHNNFFDNANQAYTESTGDVWDDGYPSGGNYWSGYSGSDLMYGLYQNETGSDGIGDTSYIIDGNNRDNYPLIYPVSPLQGDVNRDNKVDGKDVAIVAKAYNTKPGDPLWDPRADANRDLKVDGKDIAIVAKYYNTHYP